MNKVSVIICTYNRSKILEECIVSLKENNNEYEDMYEIIVVDNNSKDNTAECVKKLQEKYENIRYVFEDEQGLSCARNRGIKEATKDIVTFIDDDVIVHKDYIKYIIKYFKENQDSICGAGKINTIWGNQRPKWFNDGFFSIIGETKYGDKFRELVGNEYPYGGNMFFKKYIFKEVGEFDTNLGVSGDKIVMGEEVDLCSRIKAKNSRIFYEPRAVVDHRVHINKVNKDYILKRWDEEGKATGKIARTTLQEKISQYKLKRYAILLLRDYPKYFLSKVFDRKNEFFYYAKIHRNKSIINELNK
ncbi:glycosyltransferase family 2 protein [Clostridium chrysemydis]|uniref:glycosyltransferase family 2 protein n=1 Tax=Clostridium chrysemydis TaxID=2665504 RepID=UPI003F3EE06E